MTANVSSSSAPGGLKPQPWSSALEVRDLYVRFAGGTEGEILAVDGLSFDVGAGEVVAVVGESGSGKTAAFTGLMRLLDYTPGAEVSGEILVGGRRLEPRGRSNGAAGARVGRDISMVFQNPLSSLDPVVKIGRQISEAIRTHNPDLSKDEVRQRSVGLLRQVGIPEPEARSRDYPHRFSGGMRQRVVIAMAIANAPQVLIADEPTTALDVTIQAQVLETLLDLRNQLGMAMVLITHDLRLAAEVADRVMVMYAGRIVEVGPTGEVLARPRHPYTSGLLAALPDVEARTLLSPIRGSAASSARLTPGCGFLERCDRARGRSECESKTPPLYLADETIDHRVACHFHAESPPTGDPTGVAR